ncbi:hypothetical protein V498_06241 [Pseudogymnoascus sp. VKM F-4517 (FW-2822)]|nr:hypothetical protein V498_06241 [Pseudogymnoascus sp. VKM F-4517 (FW-2822)]
MSSLLLYAATALITYIAYSQLFALFQAAVRKAPPVAANSWWTFLRGKSVPGNVLIEEFYEKYSKNNEAFMAGGYYVLPPSVFAAIRKIPDRIANSTPANEDGLVLDPFLGHDNTDIIHLVRTDLTRSVDAMIAPLKDEIHLTLSTHFLPPSTPPTLLSGEQWYPLTVHPSTLSAIGRITTRILVGAKYTTLPAWTTTLAGFANGIIIQSFLLRKLPRAIIPLIAPFFNTTRRVAKLRALILPDVRALLANPPTPGTYPDGEPTVLPMMVNYVLSRPGYAEAEESTVLTGVIGRLLDFSFAAVDTTTITLTHCIHDLVSHPPALYANPILTQARSVLATHNGVWTTQALSALPLLESFIKESQRLHPVGQLLSQRKVLDPAGVTLYPAEGFEGAEPIHLPYGAVTQMPTHGIHMDGGVYEEPRVFRGFRFAGDKVPSSQPSDRFMSFGHGKHACPGRHLALVVVKLFLLEFLERFEFKEVERPKDWQLGFMFNAVPDMKTNVWIRPRREDEEVGA